jgi:hypothetical protein
VEAEEDEAARRRAAEEDRKKPLDPTNWLQRQMKR